jgi:hypothetical protein
LPVPSVMRPSVRRGGSEASDGHFSFPRAYHFW